MRKLVILAREAGYDIEPDQVRRIAGAGAL